MNRRTKLFISFGAVMLAVLICVARSDRALAGYSAPPVTSAPGSGLITYADQTVATTCAIVLAAKTTVPGTVGARLSVIVQNNGSTYAARCGDANTRSTGNQGVLLNPAATAGQSGGSVTFTTTGSIYCCGISGSATIGVTESDQ